MRTLTCNTCGMVLGCTGNSFPFSSWCSEECAEVSNSPKEDRDEIICELSLAGMPTRQIGRLFGTSYQNIQQILGRRIGPGTTDGGKAPAGKEKAK